MLAPKIGMDLTLFTNVCIYKSIAVDAYNLMNELLQSRRKPKEDGTPGWVIVLDPDQKSFKQAFIAIVFTGMWLEAFLHIKIVQSFGEEEFQKHDFSSYEDKLKILGCDDQNILEKAKRFRKSRKEIVHEKAYFATGEIKAAQDEAERAIHLLNEISNYFN